MAQNFQEVPSLSSYFEKQKEKIQGHAPSGSPYTTGAALDKVAAATGTSGTAPTSTPSVPSAPAPAPAPTSTPSGGSGFVGFQQYFGANAPAIQQQSQQAFSKAMSVDQPSSTGGGAASSPSLMGNFSIMDQGGGRYKPSVAQTMQRQGLASYLGGTPESSYTESTPYSQALAESQQRVSQLTPLAQIGGMQAQGSDAFTSMLAGGSTQRLAAPELKTQQQQLANLTAQNQAYQQARQQARTQAQDEALRRQQYLAEDQSQQAVRDAQLVEQEAKLAWESENRGVNALKQGFSFGGWNPDQAWDALSDETKKKYRQQAAGG